MYYVETWYENLKEGVAYLTYNGYKNVCHCFGKVFSCSELGNELNDVAVIKKNKERGKLSFRYGAMGSSKTASMLMCAFNYEERGQKCLVVKSGVDTRDGALIVKSRIGLQREAITIEALEEMSATEIASFDAIVVDEVQFATEAQIEFLADITDILGVTVLCFGLRADFTGHLFVGSKRLFELADEFVELKTVCWCGHKATFNARYNEDGIVRTGDVLQLGANDSYVSVCRHHFKTGELWGPKK